MAKKAPVLGGAGVVDLGDAGVLQAAEDARFPGEAPAELGRVEARAHDLQGDRPPRVIPLGLVDGAHAALAQAPHDAVAADGRRHGPLRRRQCRADIGGRAAQEFGRALGLGVEVEELLDGGTQVDIAGTGFVQEGTPPPGTRSAACRNSSFTDPEDGSGMTRPLPA